MSIALDIPNVNFIKVNIVERFFAEDLFDFVFSIALMEHIPKLEPVLSNIFALLRPRGAYAYFQAPFWTCKTGHHFNHDDQAVRRILNSYEHIKYDKEEMKAYLQAKDDLPFDINECLRKIYTRPDLSRLSLTETRRIVRGSDFVIDAWEERPDADFEASKAETAMLAHSERYTLDDFRVDAVFARLIKP